MDKLPELYTEAVRLLEKYDCFRSMENEKKIRSIVDKKSTFSADRRLCQILTWIHRSKIQLANIIKESEIHEENESFCKYLAYVLTIVLIKDGPPSGGHESIKIFKKYHETMLESAKRHKILENENCSHHPVYVKVDTAKKETEFIHSELKGNGYILQKYDSSSYESFLGLVKDLDTPHYLVDFHIKDMLIFPAGTELRGHQFFQVTEKEIYIRGLLSGVGENSKVIHISDNAVYGSMLNIVNKMNDKGKLVAFVKPPKYLKKHIIDNSKVSFAAHPEPEFLEIKPSEYNDIEYVFLSPRSTQSGIRPKQLDQNMIDNQKKYLNQALSLPNVKEVIYSTNSIMAEENEEVVKQALLEHKDEFNLADLSSKFQHWKNFGFPAYDFGAKCLRLDPSTDFCTGAFFAKFVRNDKENFTPNGKRKMNEDLSSVKIMKADKSNTIETPAKFNGTETPAKNEADKSNRTESSAKKKKKKKADKSNRAETPAKNKADKSNGTETPAKPKENDKINGTETPAKNKADKSNETESSTKKRKRKKADKFNGTETPSKNKADKSNGTETPAKNKADKSDETEPSTKKKRRKKSDKFNGTETPKNKADKSNGTESSAKKKKVDKSNEIETPAKKKKADKSNEIETPAKKKAGKSNKIKTRAMKRAED